MECNNTCCINSNGWNWECSYEPTGLGNDWTFIIKFDGKLISTRFLYEQPTTEEIEELLEETKNKLLK